MASIPPITTSTNGSLPVDAQTDSAIDKMSKVLDQAVQQSTQISVIKTKNNVEMQAARETKAG